MASVLTEKILSEDSIEDSSIKKHKSKKNKGNSSKKDKKSSLLHLSSRSIINFLNDYNCPICQEWICRPVMGTSGSNAPFVVQNMVEILDLA